jgi:hypothetical protein
MYDQVLARDDFALIKIIDKMSEATDEDLNYLMRGDKYTILMKNFKTDRNYKGNFVLDASLTELLRKYILQNNLTTFLFPGRKNSHMVEMGDVIKRMNVKIGVENMTMNGIRHSYISYYVKKHPDMTFGQKQKFSKRCFHSAAMTESYIRDIAEHSQFEADSQMFDE